MKKIFLLFPLLSLFLFAGCERYKQDNPYDKKNKKRTVNLTFSHSIVSESVTTNGKIDQYENVYFKVIINNSGPDVAYFTEFYATTGGNTNPPSAYYDIHPREDGSAGTFTAGNPYQLEGFCDPNNSTIPKYNIIGGSVFTVKLYRFSFSPAGVTVPITLHVFDNNKKEYTYDFSILAQ